MEDRHHALPLPLGAHAALVCPCAVICPHVSKKTKLSSTTLSRPFSLVLDTSTTAPPAHSVFVLSVRMLQEAAALYPNPLAALHAHRKVMAVIGIYYCPSIPDVARAYSAFELQCKWVPYFPLCFMTPSYRNRHKPDLHAGAV